MNKKIIVLVSIVSLFMSCNQTKKEKLVPVTVNSNIAVNDIQKSSDGYVLMKNNCYACHNPNATSHDDILAPPFKAVKMRYMRQYDTQNEFVNAMANWLQNPDKNTALMRGAVVKFNAMPKLALPLEDLRKIAEYIYEHDIDEPEWMEEHMKEMRNQRMKGRNN